MVDSRWSMVDGRSMAGGQQTADCDYRPSTIDYKPPTATRNTCGTLELPLTQLAKRRLGFTKRKCLRCGVNRDLLHNSEEILAVFPGEVGHRPDRAFAPQDVIGEGRDVRHVNPGAHDGAALSDRLQRCRNEGAHRGKDDRRVERLRRRLVRAAGPGCSKRQGKLLSFDIATPGKGEHLSALSLRDLCDNVGRRSEPVQADSLRISGGTQGTETDETGAQQRRCLYVSVTSRNRVAVPFVRQGKLRVSPSIWKPVNLA